MAGGVSQGSSRRGRKRVMAEINVVPYIDVTLVLLIIFMITAPLVTQSVQVELPQAPSQVVESSENEPVNVTVDREGQIYVDIGENPEQPVDEQTLVTRVSAIMKYKPETQVYVGGDNGADYGNVVRALTALTSAGVKSVGLRTDPPSAKAQ
ncbi:MAG: protein TolR [Proteobacteria bacterium]|nr:protein TolR [Pseudomonadota bacterium]MBK8958059.1 protein TolR [Pseudomonadota bacterium]